MQLLKKTIDFINGNTKNIAIFCTAATVVACLFFLYYFDRMNLAFSGVYCVPVVVYHLILNSNHKTRKQ